MNKQSLNNETGLSDYVLLPIGLALSIVIYINQLRIQ